MAAAITTTITTTTTSNAITIHHHHHSPASDLDFASVIAWPGLRVGPGRLWPRLRVSQTSLDIDSVSVQVRQGLGWAAAVYINEHSGGFSSLLGTFYIFIFYIIIFILLTNEHFAARLHMTTTTTHATSSPKPVTTSPRNGATK